MTIGLIAHDATKASFERFMRAHHVLARRFRFMAPEDTAAAIADLDLEMEVLAPDTLGGDLQVAAAVVEGRLDAVVFLHDPLAALSSEPPIANLLKVCDLEPIPIVTNVAAAEVLFHHLERVSDRPLHVPDRRDDVERVLVLSRPIAGEDDPAANR